MEKKIIISKKYLYHSHLFVSLLFLLNISLIYSQSSYVYFQLKQKDDTYLKSLTNITDIMKYIYLEPLITEIKIGEPEQNVNIILRTNCFYAYITSENHKIKKLEQTSDFIQKKFGNFKYYNSQKSTSSINYPHFVNFSYPYYNKFTWKLINDNFNFNGKKYNLNMTLAEYIELEEPGAFCLQIDEDAKKNSDDSPSFPVILKKKLNLINNYNWFIYYDINNNIDYLIIGTTFNEFINPKTGKKIISDYEFINYVYDEYDVYKAAMRLNFDDIYLILDNNEKIEFGEKTKMKGKLMPNIGFIVGTPSYSEYIEKNIFGKYEKCNKKIFSQRPELTGEEYSFFYCDDSLFFEVKKLFKAINFKHTSFSENFVLNFEDVFIRQNGYLIFLVIFSTHEHFYWDLGKPFTKKYQLEFDFDNKKIGYYKLKEKLKENENNTFNYFLIIFGIIILSCVLIALGIYVGKYYFKVRKKRANELDDEFDYQQNKESHIINE